MAISVGDAVLKISGDTSDLEKSLKTVEGKMQVFGKNTKKVAIGMMAAGAGIVTGFVASAKAANTERIGIERLSQTLKNVGVEYDQVKDSLEGVILATQRKTGVADDEQRDALNDLLLITNDYNESLRLLPLAIDLAAAKNIDLGTAAQLVGKVAEGNIGILGRYGIVMEEGATAAEALDTLQKRVAGSAAAAADPMEILQARIGDIGEAIGGALLGDFDNVIKKIEDITDRIVKWIEANPELVKTLFGVGLALIGAGGILYAVTSVSKAIIALNTALAIMQALSGPKGWAVLAAGVAIAGGAIWGINELMKSAEVPSYEGYGGRIPGVPGTPIPAIVHAGEYIGQGPAGITNNFNISQLAVREEADINRIAVELYRMQRTSGRQYGA